MGECASGDEPVGKVSWAVRPLARNKGNPSVVQGQAERCGRAEGGHDVIGAQAGAEQRPDFATVQPEWELPIAEIGAVQHPATSGVESTQVIAGDLESGGGGAPTVNVEGADPCHASGHRGHQVVDEALRERRVCERVHAGRERPIGLFIALGVRHDRQHAFVCPADDGGQRLVGEDRPGRCR